MASTGAVVYLRPRVAATYIPARSTSALTYLTPRVLSGLWTASGVSASADLANLRAWLPPQRTPFAWVTVGGQRLPVYIDATTWYRFFQFVADVRLGGADGATIPDIVAAVVSSLSQSATTAAVASITAQQTQANAEALAATVQVVQTASLPGSTQIPPVQQGTEYP